MELATYPNPILRAHAAALPAVSKAERRLMLRMLKHMRRWQGIGLAAPQIGRSQQLFVAEVEGNVLMLANPEILEDRGTEEMAEGCLSLPGTMVRVRRSAFVWVRGLNEENRPVEHKIQGLIARVVQHEFDHLHGKLITDYGPALAPDEVLRAGGTT
ncbi:MAG: peptide deformylase [Kiritimatiellae bacterium]|nr:peptide deformylase [Kiritimatiellia bacterium]